MAESSDITFPAGDLLDLGSTEYAELERTLVPSEIHRYGQELLAQGYNAHAESYFRLARHAALASNQASLAALVSIDLARSFNERNPQLCIQVLNTLNPAVLDPHHLFNLYNMYAQALHSLCRYNLADDYYRTGISIASNDGNFEQLAVALANRSSLLFINGAHDKSRQLNVEAAALLGDTDLVAKLGLIIVNMGINAMLENRCDEAWDLFERASSFGDQCSNVILRAYCLLNSGELQLLAGNQESALNLFRLAEWYGKMASLPAIQVHALVLRSILEDNLEGGALLEAAAASARDVQSRKLEHDSAPSLLLAAALADQLGQSVEPYLSLLPSNFGALKHAQLVFGHCRRMLGVLQEIRCGQTVQAFPKFVTQAPATIAIKDKLNRLEGSDVRILIEGESGTGKSFLARQIHDLNGKAHSPFIVVDCTNLEENLFESKLFGHLRGSFTGAVSDTVGLVEQANGGTLFLDEIGELPREIQGKLLYTIEEQRYRPVGAKQERRSEFRLITATNRDIDQMLEAGTLRRDLFFRIAGFRVALPPLRDRREDIVPLAELKLEQLNKKYRRRKSLRSDAWEALVQYAWPGNVRELNSALERGYHLSLSRRISLDDLGLGLSRDGSSAEDLSWYSIRREHLLRVLKLCRGNVTKAAQLLGLNRTTLIYKLKLLDIERNDFATARTVTEQVVLTQKLGDPDGRQAVTRTSRTKGSLEDWSSDSATA